MDMKEDKLSKNPVSGMSRLELFFSFQSEEPTAVNCEPAFVFLPNRPPSTTQDPV